MSESMLMYCSIPFVLLGERGNKSSYVLPTQTAIEKYRKDYHKNLAARESCVA